MTYGLRLDFCFILSICIDAKGKARGFSVGEVCQTKEQEQEHSFFWGGPPGLECGREVFLHSFLSEGAPHGLRCHLSHRGAVLLKRLPAHTHTRARARPACSFV